MNKTININLAGLFFHIDEDAYNRLQHYLATVRKSFAGTQGADEIMSDIESRIAELFLEKKSNDNQVISMGHVEEVILVMGQPEDYEIDEEIFEEQSRSTNRTRSTLSDKQLFRDTVNGYVGGVSAGISHYLNVDAIWIRLLWVLCTILSAGWLLPVYILMWILVPEAITNNQRLKMMGKEVNISNIGENKKADFDPVVDGKADADHHIIGQKGKRGSVRFFNFIGRFFKAIFKALFKIIGLIVFLASSIGLIAIIVSVITVFFVDVAGRDMIEIFDVVVPWSNVSWLLALAFVLLTCIPLVVLSILGLRMLVSNMKSIGTPAKIVMIVLWIISIIIISITVGKIAASQAFEANIQNVEKFNVSKEDVFELNLETLQDLDQTTYSSNDGFKLMEYKGEVALRDYHLNVSVASTTDSIARAVITQRAKGSSYDKAKLNAQDIIYEYDVNENSFVAPNYVIIPKGKGLIQQRTNIILYLPVGTKIKMNREFYNRYNSWLNSDTFRMGHGSQHLYQIGLNESICLDCANSDDGTAIPSDKNPNLIINDSIDSQLKVSKGKWEYQD